MHDSNYSGLILGLIALVTIAIAPASYAGPEQETPVAEPKKNEASAEATSTRFKAEDVDVIAQRLKAYKRKQPLKSLYCREDDAVTGSHLKTTRCVTQKMRAQEEQRAKLLIDNTRRAALRR